MSQRMEDLLKNMKEQYTKEEASNASNSNSGEDSDDLNDERVREIVETAKQRMMAKEN
jgi:hypothetical protein